MRCLRKVLAIASFLALALSVAPPVRAAVDDGVRATFDRFIAAQNAHDPAAVAATLFDSPDFLWITRGTAIFGRAAAIERFNRLYLGTWQLAPVSNGLRVTMLSPDVAQIYVPIDFTIGAPGQAATTTRFLMNQMLVKTPAGWLVASILPIPVPPPAPTPAAT